MRPGADARQLDDSQSLQWSSHRSTPSSSSTQLTADKAYLYNQVDRSRASRSPDHEAGNDHTTESYTGIDDLTVTLRRRRARGDAEPPGQPQLADGADARDHRRHAGARGRRSRGAGRPPRRRGTRLQFRRGHRRGRPRQPRRQRRARRRAAAANRAVRAIVALPKPVVSVVQGPAAGVGVSLAIAADVILASDKAYFLLAFTKIGLMPDGGASASGGRVDRPHRAMRMALLAERLSAADALAAGLVSAVYPADDLEAEVDAGDRDAEVRPRGGAAQDQAADQRRDADRTRGGARPRDRRPAVAAVVRTTSARAPRRSSSAARRRSPTTELTLLPPLHRPSSPLR